MPKISVILTSFNHADYLREAVESVLNQTFSDFELLLWDDASQDNSWEIINEYQDRRIKAYRNERQMRGIWGINKAITEISSGEYIAIHHSDDVWQPEKLAKQVAFLDSHPDVGAVFTQAQAIDSEGLNFNQENHFYTDIFDQPNRTRFEWLRFFFLQGNALCHPSVLIRKSCYAECGLYRYGLAQLGDFDMWVRLCLKFEIHILQERLTRFRVLPGEANTSGNRPEVQLRVYYEYFQVLNNFSNSLDINDLLKIFPEAEEYCQGGKSDFKFALANIALKFKPFRFAELFGLNLLFEIIQSPEEALRLRNEKSFDYKSFIKLTAEYDPFGIKLLRERDGQIAERDGQIAERDRLITQLNQSLAEREVQIAVLSKSIKDIYQSISWRITAPVRFMSSNIRKMSPAFWRPAAILQTGVNLRESFRNAIGCFRREGFIGVKTRVARVLKNFVQTTRVKFSNRQVPVIPRIDFDETKDAFIDFNQNPPVESVVKLIAFYLPQFHPFPENDAWWGKGFTEWSNVGKATPNFKGHYQPHCPIHFGYYDLRIPEVMVEQARLAKQYGLYGFNYYFYWFDGKILIDKPLEMMLDNLEVDIPFCLTWANENWSRRWDGQENDVLIAQNHCDSDSLAFIRHLIKYFKDSRYIKIDDKPVLIIYRANIIPNIANTAQLWRDEVIKHGLSGLYLICAQTFGIRGPEEFGFDASLEFPPHTVQSSDIKNEVEIINPDFQGHVYGYDQVVEKAIGVEEPTYKLFRTAMLSWDNTARKQNHSHIFHYFSLLLYKQWLSSICNYVYRNKKYSSNEKIVFINAWNEWAEGTHLEPDRKYGYGYLQATYDVIQNFDRELLLDTMQNREISRRNKYAVVLHIHYEDLWPVLGSYLSSLDSIGFDLYVTTTSKDLLPLILSDYPEANIDLVENRGRDILPFINVMNRINNLGYDAICKIHSKRSVYRDDGDRIRDEILDSLLGNPSIAEEIIGRFAANKSLGMIVPEKYLIFHTDHNMTFDHHVVEKACDVLGISFEYDVFPAGSMFWFVPNALIALNRVRPADFEIEQGLTDGTFAHAIERLFCSVARSSGFDVESC